jgi:hypothetical protein
VPCREASFLPGGALLLFFILLRCGFWWLPGSFLLIRRSTGSFFFFVFSGARAFPEVSFLIGRSFGVERLGLVKRTIGCFKSRLVLDGSDQLNKKSDVSPKKYDVDGLSGRLGAPV